MLRPGFLLMVPMLLAGCASPRLGPLPPRPIIPEISMGQTTPFLSLAPTHANGDSNGGGEGVYAFIDPDSGGDSGEAGSAEAGFGNDSGGGGGMAAHFIDVDQGDATLLEFSCGLVLIDAGGDEDDDVQRLVNYLEAVFARRPELNRTIDLVIITHAHIDHTRSLDAVRERFAIRRYLDGGRDTGSGIPPVRRLREAAQRESIEMRTVRDADVAALPRGHGLTNDFIDPLHCDMCDPRLTILSASHEGNVGLLTNENHHSLVIRVDFGQTSFLFTGDLPGKAIDRLVNRYRGTNLLDVDVYHAGHHGQYDGTTPQLVAAMSPMIAVISCGRAKPTLDPISAQSFGNPRAGVIEMLSAVLSHDRARPITAPLATAPHLFTPTHIQRAVYCTAWDGDVVMLSDAFSTLSAYKEQFVDDF